MEPLNLTSPPATSIIMSPPRSNVRSPESEIVEPSIVMSSTVSVVRVPRLVILDCAAVPSVPVIEPLAFKVPDTSKFPFKSTVVAAICTSVSATISS